MTNYYNEFDPFAAEWLRALIKKGLIPDGEVDTRSITDVLPADLSGFDQCHFFAGIGGWSHALRLAGWPDDRQIWTGSCPCQPFSVAGKGKGKEDERHLWPVFFEIIRQVRPTVVMGEQVAGKAGYGWFDGVASDLEGEGYSSRAVDIPACAVNAPHIRQRLYWIATNLADAGHLRGRLRPEPIEQELSSAARLGLACDNMDDATSERLEGHGQSRCVDQGCNVGEVIFIGGEGCSDVDVANAKCDGRPRQRQVGESLYSAQGFDGKADQFVDVGARFWADAEYFAGADGKTRRAKPGICLLAHGVPNRVGRLRGYGNAIVPPLAAEVIKAFMETQ